MRRLTRLVPGLGIGVLLTGLMTWSVSAATTQVEATDAKRFSPSTVSTTVGGSVHWFGTPGSTVDHSVHQDAAVFDSGDPAPGLSFDRTFSAGTFGYRCEKHGDQGMVGTVRVAPQTLTAPAGLPFTVKWAASTSNTGNRFDVHYRIGGGAWKVWMNNTSARSKVFGASNQPVRLVRGQTYSFRVRSGVGATTVESGFSPVKSFRAG